VRPEWGALPAQGPHSGRAACYFRNVNRAVYTSPSFSLTCNSRQLPPQDF
jgi:hypothetical protein